MFRISDTFTARLTGNEQKVARTTAFNLQPGPATPKRATQTRSGCARPFTL
ncbi:MAG: hypothetical protein AB7O86_14980 [Porticoccaceae bacterium]